MRPRLLALTSLSLLTLVAACSAAPHEGASADSAALSADAGSGDVSPLTFREIKPILARTCGSCHDDEFSALADVKKDREIMIRKIENHEMPADDEDEQWLGSADGQAVLKYLKTSPELR
jgi:hypothetical protein